MKKENRNCLLYIEDIGLSIQSILSFTGSITYEDFLNDTKTRLATERAFEIIGEAVKNIPQNIKDKYPQIPWAAMNRFRNIAIQEYFGLDYEIIWDIIQNKLPQNLRDIQFIISAEKPQH
ncbi:MAG: DUF86 domain-containing protein [Fimbriimonadaceae bacterium]|nr:DUF86 domain-containing protein [Chitinophagales bacterium]